MIKCQCIKSDPTRGIVEGKDYYVEEDGFYEDCDGDIYAEIYTLFPSVKKICVSLYNEHFVPKYSANSQQV